METDSIFEKAQSTARAHSARYLGNLKLIKEELAQVNRDRLRRCVTEQLTEFAGQKKPKSEEEVFRPSFLRNDSGKR